MKLFGLAVVMAVVSFGGGEAMSAKRETALFPDVNGKMVVIPVAHTYAQCRKNGRYLRYPDEQSHAWCHDHCNGTICQ